MGHWSTAMRAIKDADVILFVLDARMPELSRNHDLEEKLEASGKTFYLIFNKIDLVSKEVLAKLKENHKGAFFTSSGKNTDVNKLRLAIQMKAKKENVKNLLRKRQVLERYREPESREGSRSLKLEVGIVGYPNVGKSAITNALLRAGKAKVSAKAGTTVGIQWASSNIFKIIDSPGVIPFEDDEVKLGVLGAKNPEKLKDAERVAIEVIGIFLKNDIRKLEEFYNFKVSGDDEYEILLQIGEARKLLKKGGVVDESRTFLVVIRDWQRGKLRI